MIHPLQKESIETKINYLCTLAFMLSEQNLDDKQLGQFKEVIKKLDCEDVYNDIYNYLLNPNKEEIETVLKMSASKIDELDYHTLFLENSRKILFTGTLDSVQQQSKVQAKLFKWYQDAVLDEKLKLKMVYMLNLVICNKKNLEKI